MPDTKVPIITAVHATVEIVALTLLALAFHKKAVALNHRVGALEAATQTKVNNVSENPRLLRQCAEYDAKLELLNKKVRELEKKISTLSNLKQPAATVDFSKGSNIFEPQQATAAKPAMAVSFEFQPLVHEKNSPPQVEIVELITEEDVSDAQLEQEIEAVEKQMLD